MMLGWVNRFGVQPAVQVNSAFYPTWDGKMSIGWLLTRPSISGDDGCRLCSCPYRQTVRTSVNVVVTCTFLGPCSCFSTVGQTVQVLTVVQKYTVSQKRIPDIAEADVG